MRTIFLTLASAILAVGCGTSDSSGDCHVPATGSDYRTPYDAGPGDVILGPVDAAICRSVCGGYLSRIDQCSVGLEPPPAGTPTPVKNAACCPATPPANESPCSDACNELTQQDCYWPAKVPPVCTSKGRCKLGRWYVDSCAFPDAGTDGAVDAPEAGPTIWLTCNGVGYCAP